MAALPQPQSSMQHSAAPYLFAGQPVAQRRLIVCGILALMLLVVIIYSAARGPANIPYDEVARLFLRGIGLPVGLDYPASDFTIVTVIRLPRILIGALVGAALACAGATMQGIFRNPLAEPGLLGITAGAGFAAVFAITSGIASLGLLTLPAFAFAGAMIASVVVYGLSATRGRADTASIILAGVAVSSMLGALTTIMLLSANNYSAVQAALGWLFGGLQGRGWDHLRVAVVPILVAILINFTFSRDLNLMLTGEETAQALGVNVVRTRWTLLIISSIMTGAAVSVAGGIGFIGLMIPHILRLITGPDYRVLLPASALGGAVFLTLTDTASRLIIQPAEIQVGVLTALLGAPFFLFLLWRNRRAVMA